MKIEMKIKNYIGKQEYKVVEGRCIDCAFVYNVIGCKLSNCPLISNQIFKKAVKPKVDKLKPKKSVQYIRGNNECG